MLFNSLQFLVFFPVVTLMYFLLPHRFRWLLLLVASCVFYCAFIPIYILILFFTILVDYVAGIYIEKSHGAKRKRFLVMSIVANVGVLAVFKYFNFFLNNYNHILHLVHAPVSDVVLWNIILPIGLSFHTFQAMSYTIEVYRGNQKAELHLGIYALYVLFYPQLTAGPIERPQNLIPQFYERHTFDWDNLWAGLRLMLWGLFKKSVIADRLSDYVTIIFNNPHHFHQGNVLLGAAFYSIQVYCDFSGYSDMAIGAARVMGFRLMKNFDRPFISQNISEMWRRWHISMSTWFRDYVYISLGGNRGGVIRRNLNLMVNFLLIGLWHGANWTYVAWGGINGMYLIIYTAIRDRWPGREDDSRTALSWMVQIPSALFTFFVFFLAAVFIRADSLGSAVHLIAYALSRPAQHWFGVLEAGDVVYGMDWFAFVFVLLAIMMISEELMHRNEGRFARLALVDSICLGVVVFLVLTMGVFNDNAFIYFQF